MKYHVLVSFQNTTNCTTTILTFEPKQCSHTVLNHVWLSVTLMSNSARCHHRSLKWFPNKTSENFIYVVWFFNQCELDLYSIFHPFVYTVVSERVFSLLFSFERVFYKHLGGSWTVVMRAQHVTRLAMCFEHCEFKANKHPLLQLICALFCHIQ